MRLASANTPCDDVDHVDLLSEISKPHLENHGSDVHAGVHRASRSMM
jgi:hypothetical protein